MGLVNNAPDANGTNVPRIPEPAADSEPVEDGTRLHPFMVLASDDDDSVGSSAYSDDESQSDENPEAVKSELQDLMDQAVYSDAEADADVIDLEQWIDDNELKLQQLYLETLNSIRLAFGDTIELTAHFKQDAWYDFVMDIVKPRT